MITFLVLLSLAIIFTPAVMANGDPTGAETLAKDPRAPVDFVWVLICAMLVMFMQAGFSMVESGFVRAKNTANILMKNLIDFSVGSLAFWAIGFALMMGASWNMLFGASGFFLGGDAYDVNVMLLWFFMLVFCATAATIVSGAMAERPKFSTYIIYTVVITAFIFPVYGHWVWGGGWLGSAEFMKTLGGGYGALDFAGSGVVHSIGGYIALAACMLIGPRIGKYDKNGRPRPIPGHSITLAVLGTFILWFGWFGFNAGSTLSAHELRISIVVANTNLAAAAGAVTAMLITLRKLGKPDVGMTCNGALAGLVAITAPSGWVSPWASVLIGIIAGLIVCYGYWWLERHGIDDVVGAIAVHGFNGTWGLFALGLFADGTYGVYTTEPPFVTGLLYGNPGFLGVQLISVVVSICWAFGTGFLLFYAIKKKFGLRVSIEEEHLGLDISEHGAISYPDFVYTEAAKPIIVRVIDTEANSDKREGKES